MSGAASGKSGDEDAMPIVPISSTARAIICLIEQASPLSRALSSGLNQLKQPLALLNDCCWGIRQCETKVFSPGWTSRRLNRKQRRSDRIRAERRPGLALAGVVRCKREHPETTRIRPEVCGFNDRTVRTRPEVSREIPKAVDTVQLWQTSQQFDIFGERHRQLLDERGSSNPTNNR